MPTVKSPYFDEIFPDIDWARNTPGSGDQDQFAVSGSATGVGDVSAANVDGVHNRPSAQLFRNADRARIQIQGEFAFNPPVFVATATNLPKQLTQTFYVSTHRENIDPARVLPIGSNAKNGTSRNTPLANLDEAFRRIRWSPYAEIEINLQIGTYAGFGIPNDYYLDGGWAKDYVPSVFGASPFVRTPGVQFPPTWFEPAGFNGVNIICKKLTIKTFSAINSENNAINNGTNFSQATINCSDFRPYRSPRLSEGPGDHGDGERDFARGLGGAFNIVYGEVECRNIEFNIPVNQSSSALWAAPVFVVKTAGELVLKACTITTAYNPSQPSQFQETMALSDGFPNRGVAPGDYISGLGFFRSVMIAVDGGKCILTQIDRDNSYVDTSDVNLVTSRLTGIPFVETRPNAFAVMGGGYLHLEQTTISNVRIGFVDGREAVFTGIATGGPRPGGFIHIMPETAGQRVRQVAGTVPTQSFLNASLTKHNLADIVIVV